MKALYLWNTLVAWFVVLVYLSIVPSQLQIDLGIELKKNDLLMSCRENTKSFENSPLILWK